MNLSDLQLLPDNDKPETVRNWRIRLALVACSAWAVLAFFVMPALLGFPYSLPRLGGVAWASDVEKRVAPLQESVNDLRELMVEQSILSAQKNWCEANNAGQRPTAWAARIRDLQKQYFKIVGRSFDLPDCKSV